MKKMRSNNSESSRRRSNRGNRSPVRTSRPGNLIGPEATGSSTSAATLLDSDPITQELLLFETLQISSDSSTLNTNPRSFPYNVKQQCWEKADKIKGRDPDRWRLDALGNTVFRKLVGCPGCLCHDYDHIVPYSKGGQSTLENCQVLQTRANRSKGNRTEITKSELRERSSYCRVSGRDMDLLEITAYGNVQHEQDSGGCKIQ